MASPTPPLTFRGVLKIRSVRRLWLAQLVSIFGDFLAIFAVFSLVTFQLHGTPTQVSMILVAYMLPLAVVSPLAGVVVDKWNVKWTMIASDLVRGVLVLVLVFVRDFNVIYVIFLAMSTGVEFLRARAIGGCARAGAGDRLAGHQRPDDASRAGIADYQPGHCGPVGPVVRGQRLLPIR
jgi:MFS family permease